MKNLLPAVVIFFQCLFCFSQNDSIRKKLPPAQDRLIVDLFHDNWLNKPDSIKTKWYSQGVAVSILYDFPIEKSNFSFAFGGGIASHNVRNNAKVTEQLDTTGQYVSVLVPYPSDYKFKKNKFSTNYADIIGELRFRTRPDKKNFSWKFSVGWRYGFLINVHDELKDNTGKYKTYIFPNTTKRRNGFHFRASYGKVSVFGFYSLTNLFKNEKGVELTPFSAGISIMPM